MTTTAIDKQLDDFLDRLQGYVGMLERAGNNFSLVAKMASMARDFYSELNGFAVSLAKPELLRKELFLWLGKDQNLETILGIMQKHVSKENRVNAVTTLYLVLTNRIEELYAKWHKFNQLYIDDVNYLQLMEDLLSRLAAFHSIELPERQTVKYKTTRNYEPVVWDTVLATVPELV